MIEQNKYYSICSFIIFASNAINRNIAECTILIFDLIEKMEEDDIPDLLFTLDFEKSFDAVGWSFLYKHCNI